MTIEAGKFKPPWWVANAKPGADGIEWPVVLSEIYDYGHLIGSLRDRANELKIARSHENTASVMGFTNGYLQKLLAPKPPRMIGMRTLGPVLGVLGAKLLLVVDDVALARLAVLGSKRADMKLVERNNNLVHDGVIQSTRRFMKKIAASGGKARASKLTAYQRQAIARKGGKARWNKANKVVRWNDVKEAARIK